MQDTSFAIQPGMKSQRKGPAFRSVGAVVSSKLDNSNLNLSCENGYVTVRFYRDDIVRVVMNPKEQPSLGSSFAVVKEPEDVEVSLTESEDEIKLSSGKFTVVIHKSPIRITMLDEQGRIIVRDHESSMGFNEKKEVICFKEMHPDDHFYGFGEKTSFLDKRGEKMTMWNTDVYAPHNPEIDALYQSIPYFMAIRNGMAYGLYFDNTFKSVFDMKSSDETYSFWAEGGQLDYYLFAGPKPKDVVEQYTEITGRMPLPPKWALGYHQSRYSYESEQEVRELVKEFRERDIPLDAIYLDIHYMDGYRVFTFDEERFPNPEKLVEDLKQEGIHVIPIVDPGVKEDPEYPIYQEGVNGDYFCKYLEGNLYFGDVWPGKSAFPDFTSVDVRKWWGEKHEFYSRMGIEGIWNDMNEPAVFNETKTMDLKVMHKNDGNPKTHRELHNLYGLLMGEATYEGMKAQLDGKRPFLLTRAGFAGVQRYSTVWTGDNRSFWEHLQMSLPMCMNLGMSGVPFCGPDVGGFAHDTTGQLLTRWTQVGMFTPYFRHHSVLESIRQEPWSFGEEYEKIIRKYIQERYVWLPYLYTLFRVASLTGVPVMRPLVFEFPEDKHTFNLSNQFMIGSDVIVAPIMKPDTYHRVVYLPEGMWVNYWTDEKLEGGKHHLVKADMATMPIFVKEGAVLIHGSVRSSTEQKESEIKVHLYPSENGLSPFNYYEDDGKTFDYQQGNYFELKIDGRKEEDSLEITVDVLHNQYDPEWERVSFIVHGVEQELKVQINGILQDEAKFEPAFGLITFSVGKSGLF
ncbi:glycoside hydrolase family 31 protein [Bacillus sp. ISL-35]|uniref:glycoside hydrolase family 31 protein n=1 Tax=Bacillus sp. ISL-35 TaxID=2819122 RepID=UPI001BE93029|nr:glycoside hydrolase family 31 protein [Bacillus sp. ISL-35]MBT2680579.1 glycoside hydrolase family 31 protein [Bacillus sp. ISL-35]MBT2704126.1 glycoside hydrolase family 31 protein [Chryseobacterium sp. ISL-80]